VRSVIDLHCHSLASDGVLAPEAVVDRAYERGVRLLALTDHDTLGGQLAAMERAQCLGVKMVSGIELSCLWRRQSIHVLGYGFNTVEPALIEALRGQKQRRLERAGEIAQRLEKQGLPNLLDAAITQSDSDVPGRPHFAQVMVDSGLVSSHAEAFKKYLGSGKAGDVKNGWPALETVVQWIVKAGGQAVIAHPRKYNMTLTRLRELIDDFKASGGEGLEVAVAGQKQGETGLLSDLCRRSDLLGSVGSDFHSPQFRWADLGSVASLPDSVKPIWHDWSVAEGLAG